MGSKKKKISDNKKRENELKRALLDNDKLRKKIAILQSKYGELVAGAVMKDEILKNFNDEINKMDPICTSHLNLCTPNTSTKKYKEEAILPLSDFHIGEIVVPTEINNLNCYDLSIAEWRINKLVNDINKIKTNALTGYELTTLHIPLLGDIISGIIHDELRETNQGGVVWMVMEAQRILTETIIKLREIFPEVKIYSVAGNHGRLTPKIRFKQGYDSLDQIVAEFIKMQLNHVDCSETFTCEVPNSLVMTTKIGEHKFMFEHGHGIRMYNGIPYYGLNRYATDNQISLLDGKLETIDHFIIGHFHQSAKIPISGANFFMNGSLIGTNEYSRNKLHRSTQPCTWFFGIKPSQKGRITFMYEMNELTDGEKHLWF